MSNADRRRLLNALGFVETADPDEDTMAHAAESLRKAATAMSEEEAERFHETVAKLNAAVSQTDNDRQVIAELREKAKREPGLLAGALSTLRTERDGLEGRLRVAHDEIQALADKLNESNKLVVDLRAHKNAELRTTLKAHEMSMSELAALEAWADRVCALVGMEGDDDDDALAELSTRVVRLQGLHATLDGLPLTTHRGPAAQLSVEEIRDELALAARQLTEGPLPGDEIVLPMRSKDIRAATRWTVLKRCTPSGKTQFHCASCERVTAAPDKTCPDESCATWTPPLSPPDVALAELRLLVVGLIACVLGGSRGQQLYRGDHAMLIKDEHIEADLHRVASFVEELQGRLADVRGIAAQLECGMTARTAASRLRCAIENDRRRP